MIISRPPDRYLRHRVFHHLLVRHIALVAHKQFVDPLCGVSINLLQPLLDVVERVHVRHIVDDADAVGSSVVGRCDGSESLLTRCIPLRMKSVSHILMALVEDAPHDLKFHSLAIEFDCSDFLEQLVSLTLDLGDPGRARLQNQHQ